MICNQRISTYLYLKHQPFQVSSPTVLGGSDFRLTNQVRELHAERDALVKERALVGMNGDDVMCIQWPGLTPAKDTLLNKFISFQEFREKPRGFPGEKSKLVMDSRGPLVVGKPSGYVQLVIYFCSGYHLN